MSDADQLTIRELDVLREFVHGKTNRQIVAALTASPATGKVHVKYSIVRLGAENRTHAEVLARQH